MKLWAKAHPVGIYFSIYSIYIYNPAINNPPIWPENIRNKLWNASLNWRLLFVFHCFTTFILLWNVVLLLQCPMLPRLERVPGSILSFADVRVQHVPEAIEFLTPNRQMDESNLIIQWKWSCWEKIWKNLRQTMVFPIKCRGVPNFFP